MAVDSGCVQVLPSPLLQRAQLLDSFVGASRTRIWLPTIDQLSPEDVRPDLVHVTPVPDHHQVIGLRVSGSVGAGVGLRVGLGLGVGVGLAVTLGDGPAGATAVAVGTADALGLAVLVDEPGIGVLAVATRPKPTPVTDVTLGGRCQSVRRVQVRPSGEVQALVAPPLVGSTPTATKP